MDWNMFVTTLSATGFASAAFVFLAKILSRHLLSMDLERFKADLRASHEKELERLRADLRIQAFERETTFSRLHDKRAQVIEELYKRIAAVTRAMYRLLDEIEIHDSPSLKERTEQTAKSADAFLDYYLQNTIYFDEALCDKLQSFNEKLFQAWTDYNHSKLGVNALASGLKFQTASKALSQELPIIRKEIEHAFRRLLGHTESSGVST